MCVRYMAGFEVGNHAPCLRGRKGECDGPTARIRLLTLRLEGAKTRWRKHLPHQLRATERTIIPSISGGMRARLVQGVGVAWRKSGSAGREDGAERICRGYEAVTDRHRVVKKDGNTARSARAVAALSSKKKRNYVLRSWI